MKRRDKHKTPLLSNSLIHSRLQKVPSLPTHFFHASIRDQRGLCKADLTVVFTPAQGHTLVQIDSRDLVVFAAALSTSIFSKKLTRFFLSSKVHPMGGRLMTYMKLSLHSGFPCINFVLEIMIPKKGSKLKKFIKHTICRWFQVPAPTFRHLRPFLTFFLIFLDFYLMISWNTTNQNPMKPVFAGKV